MRQRGSTHFIEENYLEDLPAPEVDPPQVCLLFTFSVTTFIFAGNSSLSCLDRLSKVPT